MFDILTDEQITTAGAAMPKILSDARMHLCGQRIRKAAMERNAYPGCDPYYAHFLALANGITVFSQMDDEGNGGGEVSVCTLLKGKLRETAIPLSHATDHTITDVGYCCDEDESNWQSCGPYIKISSGMYLVANGMKGHAVFAYQSRTANGIICTIGHP